MLNVDSEKQTQLAANEKAMRGVLFEEGLTNDVATSFNKLRRDLNLGVRDRVVANLIVGEALKWAIYWNREAFMKQCLIRELHLNGDNVTPPAVSAAMVSEPVVPEGASKLSDSAQIKVGGPEMDFQVYAVVEM